MRSLALLAVLASVLVAGCATTPPAAATPAPPPTMHVIEGRPEPPSAVDALNEALMKLKKEEARSAIFEKETAALRTERDELRIQLADLSGRQLALCAEVDELTRDSREAMDDLLASEIEKATLERRLLEIRLADLRKANEGGER